MNPSTFFSVNGVGSYWTTTWLNDAWSMLLAFRKPAKIDWLVPAWMPIVLPARSAGVRIGLPSSTERMQNGFFWNVLPMTFNGAPCSVMKRAVASGAEIPTVMLPASTSASALSTGPVTRSTLLNPASR